MIGELQESNNLLKSQVSSLQNDHADLKEVVRKQGILVQEHEEILGSGKIEKLFQRVDILEAKMSEIEEAISIGFQEASDDRMQIREDADKNFEQVRADISKFGDITDNLDSRASALEARMKDLGFVHELFLCTYSQKVNGGNGCPRHFSMLHCITICVCDFFCLATSAKTAFLESRSVVTNLVYTDANTPGPSAFLVESIYVVSFLYCHAWFDRYAAGRESGSGCERLANHRPPQRLGVERFCVHDFYRT